MGLISQTAKYKIHDLESCSIENIQTWYPPRQKDLKNTKKNTRNTWDSEKRAEVCVTELPKIEGKK